MSMSSIASVTSRIQELQSQLATLTPTEGSGADFADALAGAQSAGGSTSGEAVVAAAKKYLGLPYVWGGTDPTKGLDCSGLVQTVYKQLGIQLPRLSADQGRQGAPVASLAEAKPGG